MSDTAKKRTTEFNEGWKAYANGKMLSDCPFAKGTELAKLWCYGWFSATKDKLAVLSRSLP